MVCQRTMEGNSITCCRDSELLSDTLKSGGSYTSMLDRSVLLQSATECFPHRQYTIIDSPPLTWRGEYTFIEGSNGRLRDSYPEARAERQPITSCNGSPCVTDLTYISPFLFHNSLSLFYNATFQEIYKKVCWNCLVK